MTDFSIHTADSAPDASRPILEGARKSYGFLPNLLGALAESPATLEGYLAIGGIFEKSTFSATERQVVLLTASIENGCTYCVAAHTTIAAMQHVAIDVTKSLREGLPIQDPRLEALRKFTKTLVEKRGRATEADTQEFLAASFTREQALEVVLGIAMKTISNYANHLTHTPIDQAFAPQAWTATNAV
ncbi:MAG: carboxymuconolactone decarboxylase family protein [Sphingomonadales bacterium]